VSFDLDSRLRAAGTSLRASVEDIEPRPLPSPGPGRHPLLAAAAVVLVVAAMVAAVAALRDDGETDISTDPDEVPRLVLDESVVGIPASGAFDLPVEAGTGRGGEPTEVTVYDAPVGEGGVAQIGVLALHLPAEDGYSWEPEDDAEPVTVQGAAGHFLQNKLYGATVAWETSPDRVTLVASRQLDRSQLLAAVEAGTVDGDRVVPGPVAPGLGAPEALGRPGMVDVATLAPMPAGSVGHGIGYQSDANMNQVVFLTVVAAGDDDIAALRWMTAADTAVEVRGHGGWIGTRTFPVGEASEGSSSDSGSGSASGEDVVDGEVATDTQQLDAVESHTLIWDERPGVVAVLSATGFTADEVLGFAEEGIRVASDADWTAMVAAAASPTPTDAEAAVSGTDGDVTWSVYIADDGSLCAATQTSSEGTEGCTDLVRGGAELVQDDDGNPLAIYGVLPEGAVDVELSAGSSAGASTAPTEDGDVVYAITLDDGQLPAEVVFVDADGNEVGRMEVGFAPAVEAESPSTPGP